MAADAGAEVSRLGGNAADSAIAAAMVLLISEPGICAPGAGGFITVRSAGEEPVTIDANVAMPGLGADPDRFGAFTRQATMEYGGGVTTTVGYESIATPGGIAGLGHAWTNWGSIPWTEVLAPAAALARSGMPLSDAAYLYLGYSHELIFGWHPVSHEALHGPGGELLAAGKSGDCSRAGRYARRTGTKGTARLLPGWASPPRSSTIWTPEDRL